MIQYTGTLTSIKLNFGTSEPTTITIEEGNVAHTLKVGAYSNFFLDSCTSAYGLQAFIDWCQEHQNELYTVQAQVTPAGLILNVRVKG